jgi:hypothetical protein
VNELGLPCRTCGQTGSAVTVLWRADRLGKLAPYAAQCKGPCWKQAAGARVPSGPAPVTAIRPGKCSACTWDIVPGDKIVRSGDGLFWHFECAPAESPRPQRRDRTRSRVTTAQAQGAVL